MGGRNAFIKSETITIEIPKRSIFIQTDKPIYKPGQTGTLYLITLQLFDMYASVYGKVISWKLDSCYM